MPAIDSLWLLLCVFSAAVSSAPTDGRSPSAPKEPYNVIPNIANRGIGHYQVIQGKRGPQQAQFQSLPETGIKTQGSFEVPAISDSNELIYKMPTLVGDEQLMLQLDTGSSGLALSSAVLGSEVPPEKVAGQTVFDSKLFKKIPDVKFRFDYQGGDWLTGNTGYTQIGIGGVVLPNEMINVATDVGNQQLADGLIGMSVGSLLVEGQKPQPNVFLENLMRSLDRPVFAANLHPGGPSTYQFGFFNREKFKPGRNAIVRVDPSQGQWQFESPGAIVGNQRIKGPMPSLVDTGSSLLRLQQRTVTAYHAMVPGAYVNAAAGGYLIPCNAKLPALKIMLTDSYTADIPSNLIMGPRNTGSDCKD
ncbi:MAG: hypothetical protein M1816_003585 [Peltula sp. TS41687]|nr:MAG: hypothetical protein M1816_003585 [Peltula sp. TS41687]